MKKNFFPFILLLFTTITLSAQNKNLPSCAMEVNYNEKFLFGLKGGINCPRLYYTNDYISDLPHDFIMGLSIGIFAELPFTEWLTMGPELNYQRRGGTTSYIYEHDYNVCYSLKANYASIRLPVFSYLQTFQNFRPYLLLGPDIGYVINGEISLSQPELDIPDSRISINKSNMNYYYFGGIGGFGLRINLPLSGTALVIKADATINYGFTDTFSEAEHKEIANPTNVHAYNHQGKRLSRGLELHLSIGYIPEKKDDVCDHFNSFQANPIKF